MSEPYEKWDKHAIKAELGRRGMTLAALAKARGYAPASFRSALLKPCSGANRAIAQYLGLTVQDLWPGWFDSDGKLIPAVDRQSSRSRASCHDCRAAVS